MRVVTLNCIIDETRSKTDIFCSIRFALFTDANPTVSRMLLIRPAIPRHNQTMNKGLYLQLHHFKLWIRFVFIIRGFWEKRLNHLVNGLFGLHIQC